MQILLYCLFLVMIKRCIPLISSRMYHKSLYPYAVSPSLPSTIPPSETSTKSLWKLARVYVSTEDIRIGSQLVLDEDTSHYISNVMRLRIGEQFRVFNGKQDEFMAEVGAVHKKRLLTIEIIKPTNRTMSDEPVSRVSLFFAPIKKTRLKIILEKATELGVNSFIPLITTRTNSLFETADSLRKTIIESCEQSERLTIPGS